MLKRSISWWVPVVAGILVFIEGLDKVVTLSDATVGALRTLSRLVAALGNALGEVLGAPVWHGNVTFLLWLLAMISCVIGSIVSASSIDKSALTDRAFKSWQKDPHIGSVRPDPFSQMVTYPMIAGIGLIAAIAQSPEQLEQFSPSAQAIQSYVLVGLYLLTKLLPFTATNVIKWWVRGASDVVMICDKQPVERVARRLVRAKDNTGYEELPAETRAFHEKFVISQQALTNFVQAGWSILIGFLGLFALLYVNRYGFDVTPVESAIRAGGRQIASTIRNIDMMLVANSAGVGLAVGIAIMVWDRGGIVTKISLIVAVFAILSIVLYIVGFTASFNAYDRAFKSDGSFIGFLVGFFVGTVVVNGVSRLRSQPNSS